MERDIAEAFSFVRYILKNPKTLRNIRNGSTIRIVPAGCVEPRRQARRAKNSQVFVSETTFRSL